MGEKTEKQKRGDDYVRAFIAKIPVTLTVAISTLGRVPAFVGVGCGVVATAVVTMVVTWAAGTVVAAAVLFAAVVVVVFAASATEAHIQQVQYKEPGLRVLISSYFSLRLQEQRMTRSHSRMTNW